MNAEELKKKILSKYHHTCKDLPEINEEVIEMLVDYLCEKENNEEKETDYTGCIFVNHNYNTCPYVRIGNKGEDGYYSTDIYKFLANAQKLYNGEIFFMYKDEDIKHFVDIGTWTFVVRG
jgi:hypothetical protein